MALQCLQKLERPGAAFFTWSLATISIYYGAYKGLLKLPLADYNSVLSFSKKLSSTIQNRVLLEWTGQKANAKDMWKIGLTAPSDEKGVVTCKASSSRTMYMGKIEE